MATKEYLSWPEPVSLIMLILSGRQRILTGVLPRNQLRDHLIL